MLLSTYPTGAQRGKTVEVTVNGAQNLYGAKDVMFEGTSVKAEVLPHGDPKNSNTKQTVNTVTMRVTIAPDAPLGVREFRLVTPRGISSVGLFVIGDDPEVAETEPNDALDKAQSITLPVTVNGKIQAVEDVDGYKFSAKAGERITFSVLSGRLQDKIHDLSPGGGGEHVNPILFLHDASGRELASNDNYFRADPLLTYKVEKDGDYVVKIRDARYHGMAHWVYRLTITARPYVLATFPMGVQRGTAAEVQLVGINVGDMKTKVEIPMTTPLGRREVELKTPQGALNPAPVAVSDFPELASSDNNHAAEKADKIPSVPAALSGRLKEKGEMDYYAFHAEKGQGFVFEIEARRYESPIHSSLAILDGQGKTVASADDSLTLSGPETRLEFTAPNAGDYVARVRDLFKEGGESFVYRLVVKPLLPDFTLRCNPDKFNVGRGGYFSVWVLANRIGGFAGDINLEVIGLPKGVAASPARIPAGLTQTVIVLSAAPDAPLAFNFAEVRGTATVTVDGKPQTITRIAAPLQEIYFPGGGLGQFPVHTTVAAVTEEPDVVIEVEPKQITVAPGGSITLNVTLKRRADYTKGLSLDVMLRHLGGVHANPLPTGVTLDEGASKMLLGDNEVKGSIVLKVAPDAPPIENWPLSVIGQVSINFVVKANQSSPAIWLTVKK
jgi:hypothetical protein